ncbi:MAG: hypothetical protein ABI599_04645 [Flavobacteriales bacterium]
MPPGITTSRNRSLALWLLVVCGLLIADLFLARIGWRSLAGWCFGGAVVIALLLFFDRQEGRLRRFLSVPVDARFLPATRIIYALMCLYTGVQHLWAVGYGMEPSNFVLLGWPESKLLAYALNALYLGALVSLLLGRWIRVSWIVVFAVGGILIPHSLELFIKNPLNFFSIFISPALWRGDRSAETPSSGWPLVLMGVCITFISTGAGIFKLFDPVWLHGTGFYYSLNIPFFCPKHLWPLLDSWPLMLFGNWATIVFEILALPLFLFRHTRVLALICVLGLGLFLSWPMWGIGLVGGPVVLAFVPAWVGICPWAARWWLKFRKKKTDDIRTAAMPIGDRRLPGYVILLTWWTLLGFLGQSLSKFDRFQYSPPLYGYGQFVITTPPAIVLPSHVDDRLHDTYEALDKLRPNKLWEWAWLLELFDYHHLFERVVYRMRVQDTGGAWHTVDLFDEDGALKTQAALTGYIHFLKPVDAIRTLRHRDHVRPDRLTYYGEMLDDMARYAIAQLPAGTMAHEVVIDVLPLHMPLRFEGNSKPWRDSRYEPFYRYDAALGTGAVVGSIAPYPFEMLDVPAFRDKVIVPVPDAPLNGVP